MSDDEWVTPGPVPEMTRSMAEGALRELRAIDARPGRRDAETLAALALLRLTLQRALGDVRS